MQISYRLRCIAEQVPEGCRMADIGSDHGLLPTFLAAQGRITFAVAGEVNKGPYEAAQKQVNMAGAGDLVDVRLGNGLAVLAPGEVDTIVIAGMGGSLITTILSEGKSKLAGVSKLVLQPNVGEDHVRTWLLAHGWFLSSEKIIEEDGRIYEILSAVPDRQAVNSSALYDPYALADGVVADKKLLLAMGPYLLRNPTPIFHEKWRRELEKLKKVHGSMGLSDLTGTVAKRQTLMAYIQRIEEVLECLPKDRP